MVQSVKQRQKMCIEKTRKVLEILGGLTNGEVFGVLEAVRLTVYERQLEEKIK